ncbi:NRDE family protein [Paracraurococcus lichenis]|uniref:NRDE family protein n=1 Tax=Paracraurococcus lichenis TaxID=3064888 RepID=A0ABT9E3H8_9PROT|nr:NRDE family protein [Paracraurococcus sp. LOR1-02]MDO9710707.1 NRDE family protein [Paracraurococcus sp. LOR1-02]
MCTVILLHRPGHAWPVLIAANRDEMLDRPWDPPWTWWPDRPDVVGGRDRTGGGTWMAANRAGVVATVLNRPGSLGPAAGKRSRGELPLLALAADSAEEAAGLVAALPAEEWRPFNMVLADRHGGIFLRGEGRGRPEAMPLPAGLSMVTAHDPNDLASPRTARHLPRFRAAPAPDPDRGDWAAWEALLADDSEGESRADTLCVPPTGGFGTVCASLLGISADGTVEWNFAPRPAGSAPFRRVPIDRATGGGA